MLLPLGGLQRVASQSKLAQEGRSRPFGVTTVVSSFLKLYQKLDNFLVKNYVSKLKLDHGLPHWQAVKRIFRCKVLRILHYNILQILSRKILVYNCMVFVIQIGEGTLILGDQNRLCLPSWRSCFLGKQKSSYNSPFLYRGKIHGFYSSNERCFGAQKVYGRSWVQT